MQPVRRQFDPHQRAGHRLRTSHLRAHRIGRIFVMAGQHIAVRIEVRRIPTEEQPQQLAAPHAFAGHAHHQSLPAAAKPVDPSGEAAMPTVEVAELMGDDRRKLAPVQRLQQGQTQDQIMALPPQRQAVGYIGGCGVELGVDDDAVQWPGAYRATHAFDLGAQFRRFARLQVVAFGRHEPDPYRTQDDRAGHPQDDDREGDPGIGRRAHDQHVQHDECQQPQRERQRRHQHAIT